MKNIYVQNFLENVTNFVESKMLEKQISFASNKQLSLKCGSNHSILSNEIELHFNLVKCENLNIANEQILYLDLSILLLDEGGEEISLNKTKLKSNGFDPIKINLNKLTEDQRNTLEIIANIFGYVKLDENYTLIFTKMKYANINNEGTLYRSFI